MNFRIINLTMLLVLLTLVSFAQSSNYNPPVVVTPAPDAAEFIRQEAFPVTKHTGTTSVNIPIYTIKSGDISLPISASYKTNGITVNQEASWIGLGWNLNLGGVITRVINGRDDLGQNTSISGGFIHANPFPVNDYYPSYITDTCVLENTGLDSKVYNSLIPAEAGDIDLEPDYFYFNFANHSGKFILPQTKNRDLSNYKPIIYGESNVDIKLIRKPNRNSGLNDYNFVITDTKGTKYYFGTPERSANESYKDRSLTNPKFSKDLYWGFGGELKAFNVPFETSTWHLDSVISAKKDIVRFTYRTGTFMDTQTSHTFTKDSRIINHGKDLLSISNTFLSGIPQSGGDYQNIYSGGVKEIVSPTKITFKNGEIDFEAEHRADLITNGTFNGSHDPERLTKLKIKSTTSNKIIKEIHFIQDYFNYPNQIEKVSNIDPSLARLKLDSIIITDKDSKIKKPYGFTYNLGSNLSRVLPSKESFAKDHWGFYNNAHGNKHLIPKTGFNGANHNVPNGANREPNFNFTQRAALKKVSYPTKGTVTFDYGPNVIKHIKKRVPDKVITNTLMSPESNSPIKAYVYYVSQDSINVDWAVDLFKRSNASYICDNLQNDNSSGDSDIIDCCSLSFSGVLFQPDASELTFMEDLYNNTLPKNDVLKEITNSNHLEDLLYYTETYRSPEENIIYDKIPPNTSQLLCDGEAIQSIHTLQLLKGWYVFYAAKPPQIPDGFDIGCLANLTRPETYKDGSYNKYGPGLRLERQTLETNNSNKEITNYTYGSLAKGAKLEDASKSSPLGYMLTEPQYATRYQVYHYPPSSNIPPFSVNRHFTSSNNIGYGNSIEASNVVRYGKVTVTKNNTTNNGKSNYYYLPFSNYPALKLGHPQYTRVPVNLHEASSLLLKEEHFNAQNILLATKEHKYKTIEKGTVPGVKFVNRDDILAEFTYMTADYSTCGTDLVWVIKPTDSNVRDITIENFTNFGYYFKTYNLRATCNLLKKTIETSYSTTGEAPITTTTAYDYDTNYLLPIKTTNYVSTYNQELQKNVTYYKYPFMYNLGDNSSITDLAKRENYKIGIPIEEQYWKATGNEAIKLVGGKFTDYNRALLPSKVYSIRPKEFVTTPQPPELNAIYTTKFTPNWVYNEELNLNYTSTGNIRSANRVNAQPQKYYWGYNNTYPIIKQENNVALFINSSLPETHKSLEKLVLSLNDIATNQAQQKRWESFNKLLRSYSPTAMITTYTYDPLIGVTSITDPKGYTIYYHYDAFNRLSFIKDADGNILKETKYHYKK